MDSTQRLSQLANQVSPSATVAINQGKVPAKSDEDVVIIGMARTAMTKAKRGPQKDTACEAMLKPVLEAVVKQNNIDKKLVEDITIGNVLQPGAAANASRIGAFLAGYPETTTNNTINRFCSSGLQAVATVANQIASHQIDIGIGGGVESMSQISMTDTVNPDHLAPAVFEHEQARNCMMPMGITSENVAE